MVTRKNLLRIALCLVALSALTVTMVLPAFALSPAPTQSADEPSPTFRVEVIVPPCEEAPNQPVHNSSEELSGVTIAPLRILVLIGSVLVILLPVVLFILMVIVVVILIIKLRKKK